MAAFKLLFFVIFLSLSLTNADGSISDATEKVNFEGSKASDSSLIEQLKSKTLNLQSIIKEKTHEIKEKDEVIAAKEQIIREKSDRIVSLENEIASLHKKGKNDAAEQVGKVHARTSELEQKVEDLRKDIDVKNKEKVSLKERVTEAEKKASELSSKFENLQTIFDDQKTKLRRTERALQIAEEEMLRAKFEATSKVNELVEVHGAWLPPWLAVHFNNYRSLLDENWKVRGKPALNKLMQKVIEKKVQAEEWAAPHVETFKTKWVPAIKEQWIVVTTTVEPHMEMLTTKTVEFYKVSKEVVTPHVVKVHEIAHPYFQEWRKSSKPYIDQVAIATRPHVDKLHTTLKPYTQEVIHSYGKFLDLATTYHRQVQDVVQEKLRSHELTEPLATKELVWISASVLLAFPAIFLMKTCSAIFCTKKVKRSARTGNSSNSRRKGKRVHSDK